VHEDRALLEIIDDGVGFDPKARHGGYGVLGMEERVAALDATLEIVSRASSGTTVRVRLPMRLPKSATTDDAPVMTAGAAAV